MGDNYKHARKAVAAVPGRNIQSHYSENYEELVRAFGRFMHNDIPGILTNILPRFLNYFLKTWDGLFLARNDAAELFNALFHKSILDHFDLPDNLTRRQVTDHIQKAHSSTNVDVDLPPEIIMIYGESGIFERLIYDFIEIFIHSDIIGRINSWEALEAAIDIGISRQNTKDSTIFSTHSVRCGGKAFSMYIFRLLAVNYLLYRKSRSGNYFVPQKFYDNQELKKHFEANLHLLEA